MDGILFTTDTQQALAHLLRETSPEEVFIVADTNTSAFLPRILPPECRDRQHLTVLEAGEEHKTLASVSRLWEMLSRQGARRTSTLLCVGGGVLTDLGGFAAATFKRGMRCINIPTTLLAQVDASIGGKTGFNFLGLKNEIGTFANPDGVIIDPTFLTTLPRPHLLSGLAEMIKHGLLSTPTHLESVLQCLSRFPSDEHLLPLIRESVRVKADIVHRDPGEQGERRALNLGHTVGHAIESLSLREGTPLLHGEAVALGLIAELYLSALLAGFPNTTYEHLSRAIHRHYPSFPAAPRADELLRLMLHDKKNDRPGINITLLADIGRYTINNYCSPADITRALQQI